VRPKKECGLKREKVYKEGESSDYVDDELLYKIINAVSTLDNNIKLIEIPPRD